MLRQIFVDKDTMFMLLQVPSGPVDLFTNFQDREPNDDSWRTKSRFLRLCQSVGRRNVTGVEVQPEIVVNKVEKRLLRHG